MKRALAWLLLAACVPSLALAAFDPAAMREQSVWGATYHLLGYTGVEARDVDGLPGEELLIGSLAMWQLLRWDVRRQSFAQVGFYENGVGNIFGGGGLQSVRFARVDAAETLEVAALSENGVIGAFSLEGTLRTVWDPNVNEIRRMRFADIDGNGFDEVLLQTCTELTAWRFGASTPLWRIPLSGCSAILVAQLDADAAPEIALGAGYVYDTGTAQQEWRYPLGFGATLTSGDVTGDGIHDLIGCRGRQCDAFDVVGRANLWEVFAPYADEVGVVTAADVDRDGRAEIFTGASQHGSIRKMSGVTGATLAAFEKQGGSNFVTVANLDGDCDLELIWGLNGDSTAYDTFHVTDPVTMKTFWSSVPEERGSSGVVAADFSGTGHPGVLWTTRGGSVARFVDLTRNVWVPRRVSDSPDNYALHMPLTAAAQLDADPAVEYVLPTTAGSIVDSPVAVYDGATHALQWSLVATGDSITSMTAGDLTGDGIAEIVIGSSILYFPRAHPQAVIAIDGATRRVLWQTKEELSLLLSAECLGCIVQVRIEDLDRNGVKEVLALVPNDGLYAYDGRNGALLWHRQELDGAWGFTTADVDPSPGVEIVMPLYSDSRLAVLNATGETVLREKDLSKFGAGLAVEAADLDGDGAAELVVVADGVLVVLSAQTLDVLWSGGVLFPWFSLGNQLLVGDVDGDAATEIVVPSVHSLHVFEYRAETHDATPPALGGSAVDVTATTDCCGLRLQWPAAKDAASMPVVYRVYRGTTLVAETPLDSYADYDLFRGTTYQYAVTAVDAAGNESAPMRGSAAAPAGCTQRRKQRAVGR